MRIYIPQIQSFLFLLFPLKFHPLLSSLTFSPLYSKPFGRQTRTTKRSSKAACLENLVNVELLNG